MTGVQTCALPICFPVTIFVLIVDAEGLEITQALIFNKFGNYNLSYYDYICKGSELTEEIARELVDKSIYTGLYAHYVDKIHVNTYCYNSAIESFISAVESKSFHWLKNHIKHPKDYEVFPDSLSLFAEQEKLHLEAEEKTFRNPLIFVKKVIF